MNKKRSLSIPSIIIEDDVDENLKENSTRNSNGSFDGDLSENDYKASESCESFSSEAKRWTTQATQMIIKVPVEHLKKIIHTESIGSLSRETEHFVGITTVHGPLRVYRGKGKYRWLWASALILCIILFVCQFVSLLQTFASGPTVSQVSYLVPEDGLSFPAITICSYNPIRKSYTEGLNRSGEFPRQLLDYLMLSFLEVQFVMSFNNVSVWVQGEADLKRYKKDIDPYFKINDFLMKAGFECKDLLKVCSFGGQEFDCCTYARPILTDMGKCFRLELANSSEKWLQKQFQAGVNNGLQIVADFHKEEQIYDLGTKEFDINPMFANEFEDGFRYYVHSDEMVPYLSTEAISVSPGYRAYSAISSSKFTLLSSDSGGNCTNQWPNKYEKRTTYSSSKCKAFCRAQFFNTSCGCSPLVYNLDGRYDVCTANQLYDCLRDKLFVNANAKDFAQTILPSCSECLIECDQWIYNTYNSYSTGFSKGALSWFQHQNPNWSDVYVKSNFVIVNIFFRDLSYTEYQQLPSTDLVTTLSNIGGNMGMFMGMSVLSVIEVIIYFYKSSWIFISRKRRQYMVEKKLKEKEREKYLEETIEAAQRKAELDETYYETFTGRTFNRVRKFATDIRDRSISVVWPNYQDYPNVKKDADIEANKQPKSGKTSESKLEKMCKIKSPNAETNESVYSIQLRSHSVDDNLYKKRDSNVSEESFPKRKTTDVHTIPYSKKKSIVDNILQNRLFGSGAAKIEEVEDDPSQVIELQIDLKQLLNQASISNERLPNSTNQRRRSPSFDTQRNFDPVIIQLSKKETPKRCYSVAEIAVRHQAALDE